MSTETLLARGLYGSVRNTDSNSIVVSDGVLVPTHGIVIDTSQVAIDLAGLSTGSVGIIATNIFKLRCPSSFSFSGRIRGRVKWTIVAAAAAAATGRVNMDLWKNGAAISGLTKATGVTRSLNPGAGTIYTENQLVIDVPVGTAWTPGQTIDLRIELEIVVAAGAAALEVKLHCDPNVAGDELMFDFDQGLQAWV